MEDKKIVEQIAELGFAHEMDEITDRNFIEMVKNLIEYPEHLEKQKELDWE